VTDAAAALFRIPNCTGPRTRRVRAALCVPAVHTTWPSPSLRRLDGIHYVAAL
jgi:hypothetical protein